MADPSVQSRVSTAQSEDAVKTKIALWKSLARLIRLSNQSGTLLLMLPTLWALVLASQGRAPGRLVLIFGAGSFQGPGYLLNLMKLIGLCLPHPLEPWLIAKAGNIY